MLGANVWRDDDLGVSEEIEEEFREWLAEKLPHIQIDEISGQDIKVSDNLTIHFRWMDTDEIADDVIKRGYSVYEVILNGAIGSSFFIREFDDNYSKTFVYERQEYSPSALRHFIIYGTHGEWDSYYELIEEHVKYGHNQ